MMMASGDPFDGAIAVTRSPNQSPDSNPAVWNAAIVWPGPGSATVSIALNAMRAELGHIGSSCTQVVSVNCEMLSGVLKNDALEIRVEKTRVGGRFAFLRSTLVNLGQLDGKKQPKEAVISTISAVFCAPERTPKSPPFPSSPRRVVPPKFEDCVSLQSLIEKYRKPNLMIKESWDWKMDPAFAANLQSVIENAEKDGLDVTGVRQRIADFVEKIKGNVGFYFCR